MHKELSLQEIKAITFDLLKHFNAFCQENSLSFYLSNGTLLGAVKYGANDINPGITGWAQINGRDALEIDEKARHDGEYTAAINAGNFKGFVMDMKCIFGTVAAVLMRTDIIEGALNGADTQEEKEEVTTGE